jgi:hypothetical protein
MSNLCTNRFYHAKKFFGFLIFAHFCSFLPIFGKFSEFLADFRNFFFWEKVFG